MFWQKPSTVTGTTMTGTIETNAAAPVTVVPVMVIPVTVSGAAGTVGATYTPRRQVLCRCNGLLAEHCHAVACPVAANSM